MAKDNWTPKLADLEITAGDAKKDHEENPEYELHVGRRILLSNGTSSYRTVSVWIQGRRYSGTLHAD